MYSDVVRCTQMVDAACEGPGGVHGEGEEEEENEEEEDLLFVRAAPPPKNRGHPGRFGADVWRSIT